MALYAEEAVVEDPVGSQPRAGHAAIHEFYATLQGLDRRTRLLTVRIAGGEAAFHFEVATLADGPTDTLSPVDVMAFDDDGRVTSVRAYWADEDLVVGWRRAARPAGRHCAGWSLSVERGSSTSPT